MSHHPCDEHGRERCRTCWPLPEADAPTIELTKRETAAINAIQKVASKWPKSLWLYSASGSLHVMRKKPNGEHAMLRNQGTDPRYSVAIVDIENDGGDW